MSAFSVEYAVDACRSPEEDFDENGWGSDESDLAWADDPGSCDGEFLDDRSGKLLDGAKVKAALEEELKELERRGVYELVDVDEFWRVNNKGPLKMR